MQIKLYHAALSVIFSYEDSISITDISEQPAVHWLPINSI